jgi:hypothetical protein
VFEIRLNPTARLDPAIVLAPAGTWRVTLTDTGLTPRDRVQAWIQRDESLYGYPRRGRQSYFDHADYVRFDHGGRAVADDASAPRCLVKRAGLINAIATGPGAIVGRRAVQTIVIGGYQRRAGTVAAYSAGGPTTPPRDTQIMNRPGPDALAPSEDLAVHRGVLAAGTRSGSVVALGGTSVAAPRVARMIAERLAAGRRGDGAAVRDQADKDEAGRPRPGRPGEARGGKGRLALAPAHPLRRFEA